MPKTLRGTMHGPAPIDRNSALYRYARSLTHAWFGSAEHDRIDSTEAVCRALIEAGAKGFIDVPEHPGNPKTMPATRVLLR